jgi:hypothetical protein
MARSKAYQNYAWYIDATITDHHHYSLATTYQGLSTIYRAYVLHICSDLEPISSIQTTRITLEMDLLEDTDPW